MSSEDFCEDSEDEDNNDPDYDVSNESESSDDESNASFASQNCNENENNTTNSSLDTSKNTYEGKEVCDDTNLIVLKSQEKGANKKCFCMYCKTVQTKFARHLETIHKNEAEVKKFSLLPKGKHNFYAYVILNEMLCYAYLLKLSIKI